MNEVRALLGMNVVTTMVPEPNHLIVASHEPILSSFDFQKMCSVLCAYRFFEIISLRAQCALCIPTSYPRAYMFLPGPPSTKDCLDVSVRFWLDFTSDDIPGIFPFARLAEASKNIPEISAKDT